jgi:hypothetical protein
VPNWSPAVDFTTTDESTTWNQPSSGQNPRVAPSRTGTKRDDVKGDRIFGTSGRGIKGTVTEYRYGMRADIHLDLDYAAPMRRAWTFPGHLCGSGSGLYTLLAVPEGSDVLHLSDDLSQASQPNMAEAAFDTASRTLDAAQIAESIVQVTEESITILTGSQRHVSSISAWL